MTASRISHAERLARRAARRAYLRARLEIAAAAAAAASGNGNGSRSGNGRGRRGDGYDCDGAPVVVDWDMLCAARPVLAGAIRATLEAVGEWRITARRIGAR